MVAIELRETLRILWKKIWIILLVTVFTITASAIITYFFLEPEYKTFTTLMVVKPQKLDNEIGYDDVLLNEKLVFTYGEIIKSKIVLNEVIENLNLDITYETFRKKIKVAPLNNTEIIKIDIKYKDRKLTADIANNIADVFVKHIVNIMKIENIQVIDKAEIPLKPDTPKLALNMAIAGILGVTIGIYLVFLLENSHNTIRNPDDIESGLNLSVIGMIPKITQ